jgi:hypothetical protein
MRLRALIRKTIQRNRLKLIVFLFFMFVVYMFTDYIHLQNELFNKVIIVYSKNAKWI